MVAYTHDRGRLFEYVTAKGCWLHMSHSIVSVNGIMKVGIRRIVKYNANYTLNSVI